MSTAAGRSPRWRAWATRQVQRMAERAPSSGTARNTPRGLFADRVSRRLTNVARLRKQREKGLRLIGLERGDEREGIQPVGVVEPVGENFDLFAPEVEGAALAQGDECCIGEHGWTR